MATREYVGARYVPRFTGLYDATQIYDALDVVDNGSGTSYIAKKTVPAGTPLTNTAYWFVYGASSGAILSLQNRMDAVESNIAILDNNKSRARKAIYLGNSYANGEGTEAGNGLYTKTKGLFADSRLYFNGGVGFLTYPLHSITFTTLLTNAIADSGGLAHDEVTDIIILSAWGDTAALLDGSTVNDFITAMSSFVSLARTNFPNLIQIRLALVETRCIHDVSTSAGTSHYPAPFRTNQILKNSAARCGIDYMGWIGWELFMTGAANVQSDGYHPSALGNIILSSYLREALVGTYQYNARSESIAGASGISSGAKFILSYIQTPLELTLNVRRVELVAGSTPAQYSTIHLADLFDSNNDKLIPAIPEGINRPIDTWIVLTAADSSVLDPFACTLKEQNGKGYIEGQAFNASHSVSTRSNASVLMQTLHVSYD